MLFEVELWEVRNEDVEELECVDWNGIVVVVVDGMFILFVDYFDVFLLYLVFGYLWCEFLFYFGILVDFYVFDISIVVFKVFGYIFFYYSKIDELGYKDVIV